MKNIIIVFAAILIMPGCVAKRYLTQSENTVASLRADSTRMQSKIATLENQITTAQNNIESLNKKITGLSSQNTALGQQSLEQQDQLTQSQKDLRAQQQRLVALQNLVAQQRAASDQLKNKMTEALKGFNSNDLSIYQKDGKVYVSLSENLLFPSGSAVVNSKGVDALSKLASVLNLNNDVSVDIEGHTDSIPIRGKYQDNWDLSTARANSIVRVLVNNYKVDPKRVVSSGHSSYDPVASNATAEGRAKNRRTDIILSPKLEEMYKLLGQ